MCNGEVFNRLFTKSSSLLEEDNITVFISVVDFFMIIQIIVVVSWQELWNLTLQWYDSLLKIHTQKQAMCWFSNWCWINFPWYLVLLPHKLAMLPLLLIFSQQHTHTHRKGSLFSCERIWKWNVTFSVIFKTRYKWEAKRKRVTYGTQLERVLPVPYSQRMNESSSR